MVRIVSNERGAALLGLIIATVFIVFYLFEYLLAAFVDNIPPFPAWVSGISVTIVFFNCFFLVGLIASLVVMWIGFGFWKYEEISLISGVLGAIFISMLWLFSGWYFTGPYVEMSLWWLIALGGIFTFTIIGFTHAGLTLKQVQALQDQRQ